MEEKEVQTNTETQIESEEIIFHDDVPAEQKTEETGVKKKISKKTIIALCCLAVYIIINIISNWSVYIHGKYTLEEYMADPQFTATASNILSASTIIQSLLSVVAFLGSIVFGAMALSETNKKKLPGKGLTLVAIIGPFILSVIIKPYSLL